MALPAITQMLKSINQDVKVLHIEPTDACNAACPQCSRETDSRFDKNNLHHLSVDNILSLVSDDQIKILDKMFMCGDYGDPAAGKHTLEIYQYFRSVNPSITLGMNTNGGLRSTNWWTELGKILNTQKDYVIFSLDGLSDTNHIYRVNVDYDKVIDNARAFISAGGNAHWEMLIFEHNQHQVDLAEQTARQLGFRWFRAKISARFDLYPVEFLRPPMGWQNPTVKDGHIECQILKDKSLYISAQGKMYPCCWLGVTDYTIDKFDLVKQSWLTDPIEVCSVTCRKGNFGSKYTNQWKREVEF